MRTPTWCRAQATDIGPACADVIAELLSVNALFRLRAAQGVLGLAGRHGRARLEAACALALEVGDPSYRTIKGILVAGTEHQPAARDAGDGGAPAHLHGPERLFADPTSATHSTASNVVALRPTSLPSTSASASASAASTSSSSPVVELTSTTSATATETGRLR